MGPDGGDRVEVAALGLGQPPGDVVQRGPGQPDPVTRLHQLVALRQRRLLLQMALQRREVGERTGHLSQTSVTQHQPGRPVVPDAEIQQLSADPVPDLGFGLHHHRLGQCPQGMAEQFRVG